MLSLHKGEKMKNPELKNLKAMLTQLVGNKRYFTSIDRLFTKMESLELTADEKQALNLLRADLQSFKNQKEREARKQKFPFY